MYKFQTRRLSGTGTSFLDTFDQEGFEVAFENARDLIDEGHEEVYLLVFESDNPKKWGAEKYKIELVEKRILKMHWGTQPPETRIHIDAFEEEAGLEMPELQN